MCIHCLIRDLINFNDRWSFLIIYSLYTQEMNMFPIYVQTRKHVDRLWSCATLIVVKVRNMERHKLSEGGQGWGKPPVACRKWAGEISAPPPHQVFLHCLTSLWISSGSMDGSEGKEVQKCTLSELGTVKRF